MFFDAAPMLIADAGVLTSAWNPADKTASVALSSGNYTATKDAASGAGGVRGIQSRASGKRMIEFGLPGAIDNRAALVVAAADTTILDDYTAGCVVISRSGTTTYLIVNANVGATYSNTGTSEIFGLYVDLTAGRVWASRGGVILGGDPAAGTGGLAFAPPAPAFPAAKLQPEGVVNLNTGQAPFLGPSLGFAPWG